MEFNVLDFNVSEEVLNYIKYLRDSFPQGSYIAKFIIVEVVAMSLQLN